MKNLFIVFITLLYFNSLAQEYQDHKIMNFSRENIDKIHLHNYRGMVSIQGADTDQITLEVERNLKTASEERLEDGKDSIYYESMLVNGDLFLFIVDPERVFRIDENGEGYYQTCNWNFSSNRERYQIKYDFNLKLTIPKDLDLKAFNHEESLTVENVAGTLHLKNHHDGVTVTGAAGNAEVHSHHGDINISFIQNPTEYLKVSTHHGDIRVELQPSFSAEVGLKSRHGSFYTDFDWQPMPMQVNRIENGNKHQYKVGEYNRVRIGDGKVEAQFETYHGDVFIALK